MIRATLKILAVSEEGVIRVALKMLGVLEVVATDLLIFGQLHAQSSCPMMGPVTIITTLASPPFVPSLHSVHYFGGALP